MKLQKLRLACLALVASLTFVTAARADLIGNNLTGTGSYLNTTNPIVGAGAEFSGVFGYMDFDFGANTLTIVTNQSLTGWSGFGSYVFSGFTDTIVGMSIASNSGFSGAIVDSYSFTGNSITLDMSSGATIAPSSTLVFNINTRSNNVPDHASTLALLGVGLVGVGLIRRRFVR